MTGTPEAVDALNACAEYERTLVDCFRGYHLYFARWRIHRPEEWMKCQMDLAERRLRGLELRIFLLDAMPVNDRHAFELEPVLVAADIVKVERYFVDGDKGLLVEARAAYKEAIDGCTSSGDNVTAGLLGCNLAEVEDSIQRIEAKLHKIQLIGPALYLAEHLRGNQGGS